MWGYRVKLRPADVLFSKYIRERAGWRCEYCNKDMSDRKQYLQNSHYYGRGKESTRFDPDNCMALCSYCHNKLGHGDKRDEYKRIMINKLGEKGFDLLTLRSNTTQKKDDEMTKIYIKKLLSEL